MKPLVIYHAQCADGFGAAFAAWLILGDDAEYVPCQYGEKVPLDPSKIQYEDREVYGFTIGIQTLLDWIK